VTDTTLWFDALVFAVFPYVALALFCAGSIERLLRHPSTLTSRSSQFLENRQHFWAMVPFHFGILPVLAGHLVAFLLPGVLIAWNASLTRLYVLEVAGLACGLLAAGGLAAALVRRASVDRVRSTTNAADWVVVSVLFLQLLTGVGVAVSHTWGSSWFAGVAAPYLRSIVGLRPDIVAVAALPTAVKLHVAGAWLLIAIFPFTRLVHVLKAPVPYLWRRPQLVRWHHPRVVPLEKRP
jgi:nitrate reductase gamma subunit